MIICGDALTELRKLPDRSIQCCVTSPPYWGLRDYGVPGQLGLEPTPEEYAHHLVEVFREVKRVLRNDGVLFLNLGDSYAIGSAPSCDTSGKVPEDCPLHDSIWSHPCDGCQAVSTLRTFHSNRFPSDGDGPNLGHTESESGHSPKSRSSLQKPTRQSSDAMLDQKQGPAPSAEPHLASPRSTTRVSFRRDRAACVPGATASGGRSRVGTFPRGDLASEHNEPGCIDGKDETASSSASRIADKVHNVCPYLRYTTASHDVKLKPKDLVGIPWRVAFALQADGWWLRSDIIWSKPNPMPESVRDRPTRAHEYIFLMAKAQKYYYDADTIAEPAEFIGPNGPGRKGSPSEQNFYRIAGKNRSINGPITRNRRSVWTVTTKPFKEAHFATFPPEIPTLCIKAGCPKGGTVLDPFCGAGTAGMIAKELGMDFIGIELNPKYCQMAERRIAGSVYQMEIEDKEKT